MDRRKFLQMLSAFSVFGMPLTLPPGAFGKTRRFNLETLESQIIGRVREILAGKKAELRILFPDGCLSNIKPVADKFSKETGVVFRYRDVPVDDINAMMLIEAATEKSSFDVALPATFGIPDLVEAGALYDLTEFKNRYEPEDFHSGELYALGDHYDQNFYGYQTDGDTYLFFYLKEWLEDPKEQKRFYETYGFPLALPKTWEELDTQLKFFCRPKENKWGGALFRTPTYIAWEWWMRFHAKGFYPFNDRFEPQIANEAGVKALEELIAASEYLAPDAKMCGLFDNWELYSQGNIFCNIGWGGTQKYLNSPKSKIRGKLVHSLAPGGMSEGKSFQVPYFNWGWNYTICSATQVPELAYLFTLFAVSPQCSLESVRGEDGFFDPFRVEHYKDKEIQRIYSPEFLEVHQKSMIESFPDLYVKGQGEYFDILRELLSKANAGKLSPKKALEAVAKAWQVITNRIGKDRQQKKWAMLKRQYPKKLRAILR